MLQHLTINHYALIEHLDIDFHTGFSVITGETGAGKSIMLGALNLLLGGRADAKSIQTGEKKCLVEASFAIKGIELEPFFTNNDIDYDEDECIIRREVLQSGKSRAFINDTPVTAAKLKEIGVYLLDIHSQHQNLFLRDEHFLINTLDTIAGNADIVEQYKDIFKKHKDAKRELTELKAKAEQTKRDEDWLQFQLEKLENANLQSNEQETLEEEQNVLEHAEEIKQSFFQAAGFLSSEETSVAQIVRHAQDTLLPILSFGGAEQFAERLNSVQIELEDIEAELTSSAERIDYDAARLDFVRERLNDIYELEQKFGAKTVDELLAIIDDLRKKLNFIENIDEEVAKQANIVNELNAKQSKLAAQLTRSRIKAARAFERDMLNMLQNLGMPNTVIEFKLTERSTPDISGFDNVVLLFSANKNGELQNINNVASGGEIARLMLSLKAIISKKKQLPTIIFDEIDTGVSGSMAERMAVVMKGMAETCQVLCITHLPQIAALGAHHYKVYKEDTENSTVSHIIPLEPEERITEIAHMLSGEQLTDAAIDNAKSLLYNEKNRATKQ